MGACPKARAHPCATRLQFHNCGDLTPPTSESMNMRLHESVTLERVLEAVERQHTTLDNPGLCIRCGADAEGVEPDARRCTCEACGVQGVCGAEELLIMLA